MGKSERAIGAGRENFVAPNGRRLGNVGPGVIGAGACGDGGGGGGVPNPPYACGGTGNKLRPGSSALDFLAAGSPQLALAKARNAMFVPWVITLKQDITNTAAGAVVPDIVTKQRITRHCVVDSVAMRILNTSGTANASTLSPQADWFNNSQLGIEAQLSVLPAGVGYPILDTYTDLSIIAPPTPSDSPLSGWILTDEQALSMNLQNVIALPGTVRVTLAVTVWNPYGRFWDRLNPGIAVSCLWDEFGIDCGEMYVDSCPCDR